MTDKPEANIIVNVEGDLTTILFDSGKEVVPVILDAGMLFELITQLHKAHPSTMQEPELTCPRIDAFVAATNPPPEVMKELAAMRDINSQLRFGIWHYRALAGIDRKHSYEVGVRKLRS